MKTEIKRHPRIQDGLTHCPTQIQENLIEHVTRMPPPRANKATHSGFEIRSPKQGYQWPNKNDLYPPKFTKKDM